jgi:hypothetical protein
VEQHTGSGLPKGQQSFDKPVRLSSRKEFVDRVAYEVLFSATQEKSKPAKELTEGNSPNKTIQRLSILNLSDAKTRTEIKGTCR